MRIVIINMDKPSTSPNKALKALLPTDIRPQWFNPIRRLQSAARTQGAAAVITISIVVNADGIPRFWTSPKVTPIEPMSAERDFYDFLSEFVEALQ